MKGFTKEQIRKRAVEWGLDSDDEEDLYIAKESLYCDAGGSAIEIDALNEGVI